MATNILYWENICAFKKFLPNVNLFPQKDGRLVLKLNIIPDGQNDYIKNEKTWQSYSDYIRKNQSSVN